MHTQSLREKRHVSMTILLVLRSCPCRRIPAASRLSVRGVLGTHVAVNDLDDSVPIVPDPDAARGVHGSARGESRDLVLARDGAADEVHHVVDDTQVDHLGDALNLRECVCMCVCHVRLCGCCSPKCT
jgi:hypothetical protein